MIINLKNKHNSYISLIRNRNVWELSGEVLHGKDSYVEKSDIKRAFTEGTSIENYNGLNSRNIIDDTRYGLDLIVSNSNIGEKGLKKYISLLEKLYQKELKNDTEIEWLSNPGEMLIDFDLDIEEDIYYIKFLAKNKFRKRWIGEELMEKIALLDSGSYDKNWYPHNNSYGGIYVSLSSEELERYIKELIAEYESVIGQKYKNT